MKIIINNTLCDAQNAGNCISELLNFKFFRGSMPPAPFQWKGALRPHLLSQRPDLPPAAACKKRIETPGLPSAFPRSQKIQTGSPFSLLYQCFSFYGRAPPLSRGASSTLSFQPLRQIIEHVSHGPLFPVLICPHKVRLYVRQFLDDGFNEPSQHLCLSQALQGIMVFVQSLIELFDSVVICPLNDWQIK